MSHESKPKIENLPQPEAEELTADQAEEAQGGYINAYNSFTGGLQARPTIEIGVVSTSVIGGPTPDR
jgi:hypothetical protein